MGAHRVLPSVLLALALGPAAALAQAAAAPPPVPVPPGVQVVEGRSLYMRHCAPCHGALGDGAGPAAPNLLVPPRDFRPGIFRFRTTPSGSPATDQDLFRTIRRGIPGTPMPTWEGVLSDNDIRSIVKFLRVYMPADRQEDPSIALPIPKPPPETKGSVAQGKQIFRLMQCWQCHGMTGKGDGSSAPTLKDDKGRPIRPVNFTKGYLKGGGAPEDVYRTLLTGLDGSPMPSYRESLMLAKDSLQDLSAFDKVLNKKDREELAAFVQTLPTGDQLGAMNPDDLEKVQAGWRWDLVYYVRSLGRRSWWSTYFLDDPYMTK
jgi:cytochrome c oxidase cbb3-type subunit 2